MSAPDDADPAYFPVQVEVWATAEMDGEPLHEFVMDHNDQQQRRVLGEQCRNAFSAGQCVVTFPLRW
jgi:hypothetical protein